MYELVDLEKWNRTETFHFFRPFEDPFFNVTVTVDVTVLVSLCKENDFSFSAAALFYSQKAANTIPEFRMRLKDEEIVIFEKVEATQTILQDDESFSFSYLKAKSDLKSYIYAAEESARHYKALNTFDVETKRIDLIYYSILPWLHFTSFKHATRANSDQTVPRIVMGQYRRTENGSILMPVCVEVNHAMMDGIHVGKYFSGLQEGLNNCESDLD